MTLASDAGAVIAALGLVPHPEGGWYRETFRSVADDGRRSAVTAIHFLLTAGQASHWHRVDADEIWCWHAGSSLSLGIAAAGTLPARWQTLGPDLLTGEAPQCVVPAGQWQAARADAGWGLASCIVAPGFDFAGFTLAAPGWSPG